MKFRLPVISINLVLRHTSNDNIHKSIVERETEMLLRIVASLDTQLFVSIHIRNNLFQDLINVGELGAELLVPFV